LSLTRSLGARQLFSVLHAPIYKITSSSIFKIFENASGGDATNEFTFEKKPKR
jgi:hypothetical protein